MLHPPVVIGHVARAKEKQQSITVNEIPERVRFRAIINNILMNGHPLTDLQQSSILFQPTPEIHFTND